MGAGSGLFIITMAGMGTGENPGFNLQQRYDFGCQQCIYAKGHRVPVSGVLIIRGSLSQSEISTMYQYLTDAEHISVFACH